MDLNLPFRVEYARLSGIEKCVKCQHAFVHDELRLAAMIQSKRHDGKDPHWYHLQCFFETQKVKFVNQIQNFEGIKHEDQIFIIRQVDLDFDYEEFAKKRTTIKKPPENAITSFEIEYSRSNDDPCYVCHEKILRNEIRIKKEAFDTEIARQFGKEIQWSHLECFVVNRDMFGFILSGVMLPGFEKLQAEHQQFIKECLPSFATDDEVRNLLANHHQDDELNNNATQNLSEVELELKIAKQSAELSRVAAALKKVCSVEDLQYLLIINDSDTVDDFDQLLDRCADFLTFGALYKCQKCFKGCMMFNKNGYTCNAMVDDWVKCGNFTTKPMRLKCVIPEEFHDKNFFATCDPRVADRAVRNAVVYEEDFQQPTTTARLNKKTKKVTKLTLKEGWVVDPASKLDKHAHVYREKEILYSSVLGLTDIERNKNSYFKLQVLQSDTALNQFWLFTSWGRIGTDIGDTKLQAFISADQACAEFKNVYQQQTGNEWNSELPFKRMHGKFYPVDVNYNDDIEANTSTPSHLLAKVEDLVKLLFNVQNMQKTMKEFQLDMEKMPLGKLSINQLQMAYLTLTELDDAVMEQKPRAELIGLSNKFFTLVPHNFGMAKAPILETFKMINEKREVVDSLLDIEAAYAMMKAGAKLNMNSFDAYYKQLNAEVVPLDRSSKDFQLIETYAKNTSQGMRIQVVDVFKVERHGEKQKYAQFKQLPNRMLLWHGSRLTNFASILSKGLVIGPQVNGSMFGRGLYFADMLCKSIAYCQGQVGGTCMLVLCEVALGNMLENRQANAAALPTNYHSTKGLGAYVPDLKQAVVRRDGVVIPLGPAINAVNRNAVGLNYNEYIVYNDGQVNIQYLVTIKWN